MKWFRIQSVDTILGDFHKIKAKLEAHAEKMGEEVALHDAHILWHADRMDCARVEQGRALTAAKKIGDLTA